MPAGNNLVTEAAPDRYEETFGNVINLSDARNKRENHNHRRGILPDGSAAEETIRELPDISYPMTVNNNQRKSR